MRPLIAIAFVFLTIGPAFAADGERTQLLLRLIRENGCQMDDKTAASVLPQYGFTPSETQEIEAVLMDRGMIDTSKLGVIALTATACAE